MKNVQPGFFDLADRYEQLSNAGDPLIKLNEIIKWESFRKVLDKALYKDRKSNAGRPPYDYILMFKILVLQSLYNLSDHQLEFQIRDRLSFMRFLDLDLEDKVPDEKTLWEFREKLVKANAIDKLFRKFDHYLEMKGYNAQCGSIVDASIVTAPKQRNSRDDNKKVKEGKTPEDWHKNPNKLSQKDLDARWTKKNNTSYYGYKDHINIDTKHKLVRKFKVTPASQSDPSCLKDLLDKNNTDNKLWGDSAYRTPNNEELLENNGFSDRMHYKPTKGGWCPNARLNDRRSKIRKRIEHVFGFIENSMRGKFIRTIGLKRATWKIGMMNLVYNMCRLEQLHRIGVS